ncbi:MAG: SRPBCC family protein [Bacteroidia bacterium]|nr:SRPBCC family protein [Bacteroidia bacterium]
MGNPKKIATEAVLVNASKQEVWNLLFNRFGETHLYNPNIEGSHDTNGKTGEIGCERECSIDKKTSIKERIVNAEEFKSITVHVIGGNMPMVKEMQVIMLIDSVSSSLTRVIINASYTTKPSFMASIVKGMFRKMLFGVLIGLKYHLETGNAVSKKSFKSISEKYSILQGSQAFVA